MSHHTTTQHTTTQHTTRREFLEHSTGIIAAAAAAPALLGASALADDKPAVAKERGTWKAGVAKAVITPEKAVWLAGYGSKRAARRQAARPVDEGPGAGGRRGPPRGARHQRLPGRPQGDERPRLRAAPTKHGLERHQVMFTFSHNHCGPRLGDDLVDYYPVEAEQVELVEEYTDADGGEVRGDGRRGAREARPGEPGDRRGPHHLRRQPPQQPRGRRAGAAWPRARRSRGRSITPCR